MPGIAVYDRSVGSRVLFTGDTVRVGAFRSHPSDRDFADSGPTRGHLIVFPRTAVSIQHADKPAVTADPTIVMIYNRGQQYVRRAIAPVGDRCEWFAFDARAILDALDDPDGDLERPFGMSCFAPSTTRAYALAHHALRNLDDALLVEEVAATLLAELLPPRRAPSSPTRMHADLADAARRLLAVSFASARSLDAIATDLGASPFHLARIFRRATGHSLHGYRTELRIRAAIERLDDNDLSALALDLGFSSHSHFTAVFRAHTGMTPTQMRRTRPVRRARI